MSIGRSKEEQELTKLLVTTLVQKEVMEPMNKIGWGHGNPPPPDYTTGPDGQPVPVGGAPGTVQAPAAQPGGGPPAPGAGAQPPPAGAPKTDTPPVEDIVAVFESMRDPQGLIMGKYKTVADALKGAGHLANMAKQSFQERDAALKQVAAIQELGARPQPVASPAAAPASVPDSLVASRTLLAQAQARLDAVLSGVEDNGNVVDAETFRAANKATREVAELAADVRVQENLHNRDSAVNAEQTRWQAVDEYMQQNHPTSLALSAEIGLHIQADPVLQEAVSALVAQGKEVKASILAWQSYERAINSGTFAAEHAAAVEKEADLTAKGQVRQELLDKARLDAGVVQGAAGGQGIHENVDGAAPSREELAAATRQMQMEGEGLGMPAATRFRHLLIGRHLDPAIFGPQR